jgi:hypothetical protein
MTPDPRDAVVQRVRAACEHPDAPALEALLQPHAVALIDTGGDVIASTRPITGADVVPLLLDTVAGASLTVQPVNGACAIVARRADRVVAIVSFGLEGEAIARVWITLSPLKLRGWN